MTWVNNPRITPDDRERMERSFLTKQISGYRLHANRLQLMLDEKEHEKLLAAHREVVAELKAKYHVGTEDFVIDGEDFIHESASAPRAPDSSGDIEPAPETSREPKVVNGHDG